MKAPRRRREERGPVHSVLSVPIRERLTSYLDATPDVGVVGRSCWMRTGRSTFGTPLSGSDDRVRRTPLSKLIRASVAAALQMSVELRRQQVRAAGPGDAVGVCVHGALDYELGWCRHVRAQHAGDYGAESPAFG